MTYAGARGETAEQMARVLHVALEPGRLHPAFGELVRGLNGHGLPRENLVLFASHNHAGPAPAEPPDRDSSGRPPREGLENNVAYTRDLEDKIVNLIHISMRMFWLLIVVIVVYSAS